MPLVKKKACFVKIYFEINKTVCTFVDMEKDTQKDIKSIRLDFRVTPEFKKLILKLMLLHNCNSMTKLIEKAIDNLENKNDNDNN